LVPGFKYHAVTVSAIFIALTIGLVLGSVFVSPRFARRQEIAITNLQHTLNNDIEEKSRQIREYQESLKTITPMALQGKLAHASIALIQTGDYAEASNSANDALQMAGARLIVHLTLAPTFNKPDEELNSILARLHNRDDRFPLTRLALADQMASLLAHGDSLSSPFLPVLEQEGFLHLTPEDTYSLSVRYAVFVIGNRSSASLRPARVDAALIRALQKQGITVIACEPQDALTSDIPAYHALNLEVSTVDNVDTDIGRIALVLALLGEKGDYGVKPTANHLLPAQSADAN
jgi:hypothetical protein